MPRKRRDRASALAFTLVELLVGMAIIGVLMAVLLPAVQAAREAARRASCSNNLRQMGLALSLYHNVYESFPPGGIELRLGPDKSKRQLAWSVYLLPYLEQTALYASLDLNKAFDAAENAVAAATVLPVYMCPSAEQIEKTIDGRGACNYGGMYGERITSPNDPPKGTMLYDDPVGLRRVTDGASKTLIISEDSGYADGQWINGRNIFDQAYAINKAPAIENDIRSEHPGGAQGLFCDGSLRFLSEMIDLRVLAAICTREGSEVVGDL